jgi:hypothetical protein
MMMQSLPRPWMRHGVLSKRCSDTTRRRNKARQTLNKCVFYGEPAQLCDAGINKIKVLASLILP